MFEFLAPAFGYAPLINLLLILKLYSRSHDFKLFSRGTEIIQRKYVSDKQMKQNCIIPCSTQSIRI